MAILEMLDKYDVKHVFGLIGETSFTLYKEWNDFNNIKHIFGRDERNIAIMAEGYARVSGKPGIFEVPGLGASYSLPGVAEAFVSGTPLIELSSDISITSEKRNFLTEYDKTSMFSGITKEVINVYNGGDIPRLMRRAFRVATSGITGPVFMRFPMNVYNENVTDAELYAQKEFSKYPSLRQICEESYINDAINLINKSEKPVIICGQGVLYSNAVDELLEIAGIYNIPVGTTMSGKGSFPENHPLSIGVVGSRGGTEFSKSFIDNADLIFFIGTNTDSASTSQWKSPDYNKKINIIHIDINENNLGNDYNTDIMLYGDAKLILSKMIKNLHNKNIKKFSGVNTGNEINNKLNSLIGYDTNTVNPVKFMKIIEDYIGRKNIIVSDPGIGAIYSSAYFKTKYAGRKFIYNYSIGGLGYALPASIGAYYANNDTITCFTTDGSISFNEGELETISRENIDVKIFIFNNGSYGWIRATMLSDYGKILNGTDFYPVKYENIAKAYGIDFYDIEKNGEINNVLKNVYHDKRAAIINVNVDSEDKLMPPVPEWKNASIKYDRKYMG